MEQIVNSDNFESINQRLENLEIFMKRIEKFMEDLEFAGRTEEAWKRHDQGQFIETDSETFLKELEKW